MLVFRHIEIMCVLFYGDNTAPVTVNVDFFQWWNFEFSIKLTLLKKYKNEIFIFLKFSALVWLSKTRN